MGPGNRVQGAIDAPELDLRTQANRMRPANVFAEGFGPFMGLLGTGLGERLLQKRNIVCRIVGVFTGLPLLSDAMYTAWAQVRPMYRCQVVVSKILSYDLGVQ
jgi:hypothetical protein